MKVLLVNSPWQKVKTNLWRYVSGVSPNSGLASLAAYILQAGAEVDFIDAPAEGLSPEEVPSGAKFGDYDYIGISSASGAFPLALLTAKVLKSAFPQAKIVLGGCHPTAMPDEALSSHDVDFIVRGEGEETFLELISGKDPEKISGLSYRIENEHMHNPGRELLPDLDVLPVPAYHLLPMHLYRPPLGGYRATPAISMMTARGCPGRCTFCFHRLWGGKVRSRSPEKVMEEIDYLRNSFGIREVTFYDDTFTFNKKRTRELCLKLAGLRPKLSWACEARVDTVDTETLGLMAEAGCHQVCFGIESASNEVLENLNKRINLDMAGGVVREAQKAGMNVRCAFMIGNPGDNRETMEQTLKLARDLKPDVVQFNITTPFPGTEMFDWADEKGCLITKDWSFYDHAHAVMNLPGAPPELVEDYYNRSHRNFYMRPEFIVKKALKIRSPGEAWMNAKAFFSILLQPRE